MKKDKIKTKKVVEPQVPEPLKAPEAPRENPEILILKNQLARTLADYDNLRKRTDEEK